MRINTNRDQAAARSDRTDRTARRTGPGGAGRVGEIARERDVDPYDGKGGGFVRVSLSEQAKEMLDAWEFGQGTREEAEDTGMADIITSRMALLVEGLHEMSSVDERFPLTSEVQTPSAHLVAAALDAVTSVSARNRITWQDIHLRIEIRRIDLEVIDGLIPSLRIQRGHFRLIVAPFQQSSESGSGRAPAASPSANRDHAGSVEGGTADADLQADRDTLIQASQTLNRSLSQLMDNMYDQTLKVRFSPADSVALPSLDSGSASHQPPAAGPHTSKVIISSSEHDQTERVTVTRASEIFERLVLLLGVERVQFDSATGELSLLLDGALYDSQSPGNHVQVADFSFSPSRALSSAPSGVSIQG